MTIAENVEIVEERKGPAQGVIHQLKAKYESQRTSLAVFKEILISCSLKAGRAGRPDSSSGLNHNGGALENAGFSAPFCVASHSQGPARSRILRLATGISG